MSPASLISLSDLQVSKQWGLQFWNSFFFVFSRSSSNSFYPCFPRAGQICKSKQSRILSRIFRGIKIWHTLDPLVRSQNCLANDNVTTTRRATRYVPNWKLLNDLLKKFTLLFVHYKPQFGLLLPYYPGSLHLIASPCMILLTYMFRFVVYMLFMFGGEESLYILYFKVFKRAINAALGWVMEAQETVNIQIIDIAVS